MPIPVRQRDSMNRLIRTYNYIEKPSNEKVKKVIKEIKTDKAVFIKLQVN